MSKVYGKAETRKEKRPDPIKGKKPSKYQSEEGKFIWFKSTHAEHSAFLSNFYPFVSPKAKALTVRHINQFGDEDHTKAEGSFMWKGHLCKSVEHGYQAAKYMDKYPQCATDILNQPTSIEAKKRNTVLKKSHPIDFQAFKREQRDIMKELIKAKFEQNALLHMALLHTGAAILAEVPGRNNKDEWCGIGGTLGLILMEVRAELSEGFHSTKSL